jgi:Flp pilus assembly protein TadD
VSNISPETKDSVAPWTHLLAVCVVGVALYAGTFQAPFVFDDLPNISHNRYMKVTKLDFESLRSAAFESRSPRPLANLSFALNHVVCGLDVSCYRTINIVIHMANGLLVYALATLLFLRLRPDAYRQAHGLSLLAALVFVAHPIQIQAVTYVVQRMTSMATLFYLLGLYAWLRGRTRQNDRPGWPWWLAAGLSGLLAFGSKQIAVTLPFAIGLVEWVFFRDASAVWLRERLRPFAALIAVVAVLGVAYLWLLGFPGYEDRDFTMGQRVLTQLRVVPFYLSLLLLPLPGRFNLIHVFEPSTSLLDPVSTLLGGVFLLALTGLGFAWMRRERLLCFAILWFLLHLLLESSVLPLELAYEHRLYLPMFGFSLWVADAVYRLASGNRVRSMALGLILVAALGASTWVRNQVWTDAEGLWLDVLSKSPAEERALNSLAMVMRENDRFAEAIVILEEAVATHPNNAKAHHSLGAAYVLARDDTRSRIEYEAAARLDPGNPLYRMKVGIQFTREGDFEGGVSVLEALTRDEPQYAKGHFALAAVYDTKGRLVDAVPHYRAGLLLDPDDRTAHLRTATFLFREGEVEEGIAHLREAQRVSPHEGAIQVLIDSAERGLSRD